MKLTKTKVAAASFGAALSSLYAAPELNADVVDLTFTPGSVGWSVGSAVAVSIDQVGAAFTQWNDSIGKTVAAGALSSIAVVSFSQSLSAGTFSGTSGAIGFAGSATGSAFFGFRSGGNVGWFSLDFGGLGGAVSYTGGQYGNAGESVHVGGIPEPTSLGIAALAMGAAGLRRRRKN